ncbi:MAG: NAD-dependent epimerase/dehydratase family protein [Nitrospirae bacterium]|nr:NAD-dependent epimerase/dehydratase family protein [Nitrospirota bacterium]
MRRNILVTGGFGFIGGHLIDYLTKHYPSDNIHVIDALYSNPIPHEILLNELGARNNLTYEICTIEDYNKKQNNTKWDQIYHLASVVGPAGVLKYAGDIIKSIVMDTYILMDLALKNNARLLDVSTSEIYGGGQEGYCSEEFAKIIPPITTIRLEYAIAKLASETALLNKAKVSPLDVVIIRPFNIAGPRQSGVGGFVLPRFVFLSIYNNPLTVFGTGKQIRAFTHVEDIVKGLVLAMNKGKTMESYNIGNPENKISIDELASKVIQLTGSSSSKIYIDPKDLYGHLYEEANDKYPNATKAITELDWTPEYTIDKIIEDTYNYMRNLDEQMLHDLAGGHLS